MIFGVCRFLVDGVEAGLRIHIDYTTATRIAQPLLIVKLLIGLVLRLRIAGLMAKGSLGSGISAVYTDKVAAGDRIRFTPVIRINPRYKSDKGLHAHEQAHVAQWVAVAILTGVPVLLPDQLVYSSVHSLLLLTTRCIIFIPAYRRKS